MAGRKVLVGRTPSPKDGVLFGFSDALPGIASRVMMGAIGQCCGGRRRSWRDCPWFWSARPTVQSKGQPGTEAEAGFRKVHCSGGAMGHRPSRRVHRVLLFSGRDPGPPLRAEERHGGGGRPPPAQHPVTLRRRAVAARRPPPQRRARREDGRRGHRGGGAQAGQQQQRPQQPPHPCGPRGGGGRPEGRP